MVEIVNTPINFFYNFIFYYCKLFVLFCSIILALQALINGPPVPFNAGAPVWFLTN